MLSHWTLLSFSSFFSPLTTVNGEHLVYPVLPPISWTSAPSPSSPCSRDGSSHSEQFPISFVHAGSSKPPVRPELAALPAAAREFSPRLGELQAVQQPAAFLESASLFLLSSLFYVILLFIPSPLCVFCPTVSSLRPLFSGVAETFWNNPRMIVPHVACNQIILSFFFSEFILLTLWRGLIQADWHGFLCPSHSYLNTEPFSRLKAFAHQEWHS